MAEAPSNNVVPLPRPHAVAPFEFPSPGTVILSPITNNSYTVGDRRGEGSFGVVFDCVDVWRNALVAKVLKPNGSAFDAVEQKAMSELGALVHVRHPKIVHVHDAFVYKGACYIISERCDNTLHNMISRPNFEPRVWFFAIARCILQAVHFAHVQGLVHCDIHPGNIFSRFIRDEIVPAEHAAFTFKLGDFGLAKQRVSVDAQSTFLNSIRPPEAIAPDEFGPVDHRVDIYHVGLVLLQAFSGQILSFDRDEILAGRPRELALALPPSVAFAIEKTLRRHVVHRTSSALEVWRDLSAQAGLASAS